MKVKAIILEGRTGFTATISREKPPKGPDWIICEVRDENNKWIKIHHVSVDDRTDQFSMAQCIQYQLDGCHGTNSMIHDYFRFVEMFAD